MKDGIQCIRQYARNCLPVFPQQVLGMFAYDSKRVLRRQCKLEKDRLEFIQHSACFLPKPSMDPLHQCMDTFTVSLETIKPMDSDVKIAAICCAFQLLKDCLKNSTELLCKNKTGIETVDYIMDILKSMTSDVLDFTCGRFESIEKCDKYMNANAWLLLIAPKSAQQIAAERAKQKFFSPIPGLVEIIANFEM